MYLNSQPLHALVTFLAFVGATGVLVTLVAYGSVGAGALLVLAIAADGSADFLLSNI